MSHINNPSSFIDSNEAALLTSLEGLASGTGQAIVKSGSTTLGLVTFGDLTKSQADTYYYPAATIGNPAGYLTSSTANYLPLTGGTLLGDLNVGSNSAGHNENIYGTLSAEMCPPLVAGSWTLGSGWSISGGQLIVNAVVNSTAYPTTPLTIVAGTTYKVIIVVVGGSAGKIQYTLGGVGGSYIGFSMRGGGTITDYITATDTTNLIFSGIFNPQFTISSISIKAVDPTTGNEMVEGNLTVKSNANFEGELIFGTKSKGEGSMSYNPALQGGNGGIAFSASLVADILGNEFAVNTLYGNNSGNFGNPYLNYDGLGDISLGDYTDISNGNYLYIDETGSGPAMILYNMNAQPIITQGGATLDDGTGKAIFTALKLSALPTGTLISPPAGLNVGDMWMDTTTSAQYPILRIRKT